jgi:hypothetical protein
MVPRPNTASWLTCAVLFAFRTSGREAGKLAVTLGAGGAVTSGLVACLGVDSVVVGDMAGSVITAACVGAGCIGVAGLQAVASSSIRIKTNGRHTVKVMDDGFLILQSFDQ